MVVASHVEGRVRIRDDSFKKEPLASRVKEALMTEPGVNGVESNTRVGSLLVLYSAGATALEKILKTISEILGTSPEVTGPAERGCISRVVPLSLAFAARVKNKALNLGMLLTLIMSVGAAIVCWKKLHVALGVIFLAFAAQHTWQRRQHLIPV